MACRCGICWRRMKGTGLRRKAIGIPVRGDGDVHQEVPDGVSRYGDSMLVKQFRFKRNNEKGGFPWKAESEVERPGFYRGFTAVGKTLADVKEFAALVRWCERTGSLERLSEMHPPGFES